MKQKMAEFLIKQLGSKIKYLKDADLDNAELTEYVLDDIDTYANAVIDLVKEVMLPWFLLKV